MTHEQTYAPAIHRVLVERVNSIQYRAVKFVDGLMLLEDLVLCKSSISGPLSARWDVPNRNRQRGYLRERREWSWELYLRFDRQVNLEALEHSFEVDPPRVLRDAEHTQQVDLLLASVTYINPPQAAPSSGTEARYTFNGLLTPL